MTAQLVDDWIPALDGVRAKLQLGACVAVVGRPHELAEAYPHSRIESFDTHGYPGAFYDLVASLDSRRVPDTVDVAQHVRRSLADDGTWLVVARRDLTDTIRAAGFSSVRRVAETPLHLVFEARP
jgi:hypothetical protein